MLVAERTTLLVPSQRFTRAMPLTGAFAGCPGVGVPLMPNTGGTLPVGAPLTAKTEATRVEIPLVKLTVMFVIGLALLVTLMTASNNRGPGRPKPRKSKPGTPGGANGLTNWSGELVT